VGLMLGHLNSRNLKSSARCVPNWGALTILLALTELLLNRPTTVEVVVYILAHVHSLGWMESERSQSGSDECKRGLMNYQEFIILLKVNVIKENILHSARNKHAKVDHYGIWLQRYSFFTNFMFYSTANRDLKFFVVWNVQRVTKIPYNS